MATDIAAKGAAGCGVVVAIVLIVLAALAFNAWIIMLIWGGLASVFGFETIGFGTAVLVSLALSVVGGFFKNVTATK